MNDDVQTIQTFFEFLGSPAVLNLIGTSIACLLAGSLTGNFLRRHRGLAGLQPPCALTLRYLFSEGLVAISPPLVALLVAVTVTVCAAVTLAGAVYSPVALMVPAPVVGLIVQVTA